MNPILPLPACAACLHTPPPASLPHHTPAPPVFSPALDGRRDWGLPTAWLRRVSLFTAYSVVQTPPLLQHALYMSLFLCFIFEHQNLRALALPATTTVPTSSKTGWVWNQFWPSSSQNFLPTHFRWSLGADTFTFQMDILQTVQICMHAASSPDRQEWRSLLPPVTSSPLYLLSPYLPSCLPPPTTMLHVNASDGGVVDGLERGESSGSGGG